MDENHQNTTQTSTDNQLSNEQLIGQYINMLLDARGLKDVDADTRKELFNELRVKLNDYINMALLGEIPEDQLNRIEQAFETGVDEGQKVLNDVINELGISIEEITTKALSEFRNLYLDIKEQ
ncbi:MAG: hypothetical protein LBQ02_00995 [Candidatus Nomurabacteria bacterium]|jgi:hypothetical protein|nr:hypothetical protein [Candidatus Nomurabacteria bacterium]